MNRTIAGAGQVRVQLPDGLPLVPGAAGPGLGGDLAEVGPALLLAEVHAQVVEVDRDFEVEAGFGRGRLGPYPRHAGPPMPVR
ncbi:hypothetical protein UK12_14745 [Saccharothrix sp. ST-888]|nr:hypothetical protein UK12_14745 [Saccharothrix sp. ST-888]